MADSQQNIDWSAIRLMALQCLSAASDLASWAERSDEDDYDVENAVLHLEVIDRAHDTLYRAIRTFSPGVRVLFRDFFFASAHFDTIARASVGEGSRPDFQVGGICYATAHQSAYGLLRIALVRFEGALISDAIAAHFDLSTLSPETARDWTILRTLSPEALRDTLIHLEKVAHLAGIFDGQSVDVLRAWIDREWAAVSPENCSKEVGKDEQTADGKSASKQPNINCGADREAILDKMRPAVRKAYLAYQYAESKVEKQLKDHEAYDILQDEGTPTDRDDLAELLDYELPTFGTWSRQIRSARKLLCEQKYTRRAGRSTGQSVVNVDEI